MLQTEAHASPQSRTLGANFVLRGKLATGSIGYGRGPASRQGPPWYLGRATTIGDEIIANHAMRQMAHDIPVT